MIHPEDQPRMWEAVKAACDPKNGRYDVEYRVRQLDGSWRWLSAWGIVEFEGEGNARRPVAIAGSSRDITALKGAEERQGLLIEELNHRVKNTLTAVQAIAHQTLRNDGDVQTMREALDARLASLGRAHDLLTAQKWSGADLRHVVALAIEPFSSTRFDVSGPSLFVSSKQALAMAMALHELATNAAKYGALAVPAGRVRIAWSEEREPDGVGEKTLSFEWQEYGRGAVQPPKRRGFGSRLLELAVARDLAGTARLEFGRDGVTWQATAPL
jgi:two-component sensor histidine kinase